MDKTARTRLRKWRRNPLRRLYVRWVLPHVRDPLVRQRLKLLYFAWGYLPLLRLPTLSWADRFALMYRFIRTDWQVLHAHLPSEITTIAGELAARPARTDEVMVEAGCWKGGSSVKFSLLCEELGYELHIYDSFEGVERLSIEAAAGEWCRFQGQYAAPETELRANLEAYGAPSVGTVHPGWFADTLVCAPVVRPVRLVYIDCDLAKATVEALCGTVPAMVDDAVVFSQDYHVKPVRRTLLDDGTWRSLGVDMPEIVPLGVHLVRLRWPGGRGFGVREEPAGAQLDV